MTSRADLFNIAKKHGFTRANVLHWQMLCEEDDLIALINEVLELAAVKCEEVQSNLTGWNCDGNGAAKTCAQAIREMKGVE